MIKKLLVHVAIPLAVAMTCVPLARAQVPSAEDFSKHSEISDVALSPTGDKIALAVPTENGLETELWVLSLDGKKTQTIRFGPQEHVADVLWTDVNRLVVSKADMQPLRPRPESTGELYSTDADGTHSQGLFGLARRNDNGYASVSQLIRKQPGIALITFRSTESGSNPDTALFRVDTHTGERHEIERFPGPTSFLADREGVVRIAVDLNGDDNPLVHYRPKPDSAWQLLPATLAGYDLTPLRFADDNNTLYALISDHREPAQLYRLDLAAGTRTRLAGRDDMEVAHVLFQGHDGAPFGVIYDSGKPAIDYFDKSSDWTKLHAGLMQHFSGELVRIINVTNDDRKVLFLVYSDRHPGAYYVLDRTDNSIQLIKELRPWIKPEQMATTRAIEFKTRDGSKLFGFYTASGTSPRPLIVMPHGGPYGPYDKWGFDNDAQFLASRGYGVLQVNFRGSGGRGEAFIESAYLEWGGKIQDDIADGARWAIDNKLGESGKVCIYGASFGGYSALMNPIRYPDLYRCAIGYAGIYDLAMMYNRGDISQSKTTKRYLERELGTDPTVLASNSPVRLASRLKLPILLAQGTVDRRAPMDQFDAMVKAMRARGETVETLIGEGEGHGFYKPENQARLYNLMATFLDKNLNPQSK